MADGVIVINLAEINRALARSGPLIYKAARLGLREGVEPIKLDAERLSISEISGMKRARAKPPPWSIQKIGQTVHGVYVVPKQKGRHARNTPGQQRRADKFVELMYGRSYDPALEHNRAQLELNVQNWLGRAWSEV